MAAQPSVAYFCMEYGLHSDVKTYCGGLGILAGDYLKGAKDNNYPIVSIGLKWKQGYTEQRIGADGRPYDCYHNFDYPGLVDTGKTVSVRVRQNNVVCKIWEVKDLGNSTLYLLDTDIPENSDRWITGQLYGWFSEERIAQEMVLGIGGMRALKALGHDVDVYHFNEGHAVLAGIELLHTRMEAGMSFDDAITATKKEIVFTTHTPIKEGNEAHEHEVLQYMGANLGLTNVQMHHIGGTPFNMTVAALRLSRKANAVAHLHGETAREMWKDVDNGCEIVGITNGIHCPTWVDSKITAAADNGDALWNRHCELKRDLITMVKERTGATVDEDALLIGFARRAAPYKRSDLLFKSGSALTTLIESGKVQIIFAGKAHPLDDTGKEIVANLVRMTKKYPDRVIFLENYDMNIGAALTRGVDVWLNNPRRPLEACGTSGMKAAMNGVPNCSILDGWWPEAAQHGKNGWVIGDEQVPENVDEQDARDAKALGEVLLNDVIPTYYDNRTQWIKMMQQSIKDCSEGFAVERMLREYNDLMYKV